jgi:hypothetical protein
MSRKSFTRRAAGAGVLVAIGIGIWLSNLFKGWGPGGSAEGLGRDENVLVSVEGADQDSGSTADSPAAGTSGGPGTSAPVVLIDNRDYLLQSGSGDTTAYTPTTVEDIIRLALAFEPGEDGIRLQLQRRRTARASTEAALTAALRAAGVADSAVQWQSGFVD